MKAESGSGASPELSVVVVIVSDTTALRASAEHLAGCLAALHAQQDAPSLEIIVPHHHQVDGIADVADRFAHVRFIAVTDLRTFHGLGTGNREHHDELRARGLAAAHGRIIGLLEDHARPDPHWCRRVVDAHRENWAGVGGAIENGVDRALNWAVYFCDFGRYQNPLPAGASDFASDANVAYKRTALESIRATWQDIFHETMVNQALRDRGAQLALAPDVIVYQHRHGLGLANALRERYVWGRSYAATRSHLIAGSTRLAYAVLSLALPALLVTRMSANVMRKGRARRAFLRALPLTVLLTAAWSAGELAGYVTARPAGAHRITAAPASSSAS